MADRNRRKLVSIAVTGLFLFLEAESAIPAPPKEYYGATTVSVLGIRDVRLIKAVGAAVAEAARKLDGAPCRQIFSDFADRSGALLAAKLDRAGQDGRRYLPWLIFRNGSNEAFCIRGGTGLGADPGSRFVYVCPRFVDIEAAEPGYAAALVIHEELHVLGLGENPPSSAEITARVIARCGR